MKVILITKSMANWQRNAKVNANKFICGSFLESVKYIV